MTPTHSFVVGFITCNMTYLCWLQKGSYIKIWLDHIESAYLISWNNPHTLIWGVMLWYNENTPGSACLTLKMIPTQTAIRHRRYEMYKLAIPLSGPQSNFPQMPLIWCNMKSTVLWICNEIITIWLIKGRSCMGSYSTIQRNDSGSIYCPGIARAFSDGFIFASSL